MFTCQKVPLAFSECRHIRTELLLSLADPKRLSVYWLNVRWTGITRGCRVTCRLRLSRGQLFCVSERKRRFHTQQKTECGCQTLVFKWKLYSKVRIKSANTIQTKEGKNKMAVLVTDLMRARQCQWDADSSGILQLLYRLYDRTGRELNDCRINCRNLKGDYVLQFQHAVCSRYVKEQGFRRTDLAYLRQDMQCWNFFCQSTERAVLYPYRQESEGLLALDAMQDLSGKHILTPLRGNGDASIFSEQAQLRGAKVRRRSIVTSVNWLPTMQSRSVFVSVQELIGLWLAVQKFWYLVDFVPESEHNWPVLPLVTVSHGCQSAKQRWWMVVSPLSGARNEPINTW